MHKAISAIGCGYEAPRVEIVEIRVEQGFAASSVWPEDEKSDVSTGDGYENGDNATVDDEWS